jgi:hypothetical protein
MQERKKRDFEQIVSNGRYVHRASSAFSVFILSKKMFKLSIFVWGISHMVENFKVASLLYQFSPLERWKGTWPSSSWKRTFINSLELKV